MEDPLTGVELESLEFHEELETHRATYDLETTPTTMAVIEVLATVLEDDPTGMQPLYEFVNTEALDDIIEGRDQTATHVQVTFTTSDRVVTVSNGGIVEVSPRTVDDSESVRRPEGPHSSWTTDDPESPGTWMDSDDDRSVTDE